MWEDLRDKRWFRRRLGATRWCACSVAHRHTASRLVKVRRRAFTKEQYPVLARVYLTSVFPIYAVSLSVDGTTGAKLTQDVSCCPHKGATLLRTAMLDYYNPDTTGTTGIVGMGFNK